MRPSPLLATAAALSLLGAISGPALAATDVTEAAPAAGAASSGVSLLELAVQGRTVSTGSLELLSETLSGASVAKVVVTPLEVDGTAYGAQTVTPASSPAGVPSVSSEALVPGLGGIASVASPGFTVSASETGGATSKAEASSLGGVSLLGLPLGLNGTLGVGSTVTDTGALGGKTLEVTDLALPSIADLLAALGLDLSLLPVEVLNELVSELDLVTTTIDDLNAALDAAQAALQEQIDAATAEVQAQLTAVEAASDELEDALKALDAAEADLAAAAAAVDAAELALAEAKADLQDATATLDGLLGTITAEELLVAQLPADANTIPGYTVLGSTGRASVELLAPGTAAAFDVYTAAQAAVTAAEGDLTAAEAAAAAAQLAVDAARAAVDAAKATLAAANAALDAAQQLLTDLLSTLLDEIQALVGALVAVLDATPLVSIDRLAVTTSARATSASKGGQSAEVVGGELVGLRVLGTDVLDNVLGNTRLALDPATLAAQLAPVASLIDSLTGTLSEVLSTVPSLPELKVPAPEVGLLTKTTQTAVVDGFGTASTGVRALSISLPGITVPDALTATAGAVTSSPLALSVGTLTDTVRFRPAVVGASTAAPGTAAPGTVTPGTTTPGRGTTTRTASAGQLPRTGASELLAGLAVVLMGGALVARRRTALGNGPIEDTAL